MRRIFRVFVLTSLMNVFAATNAGAEEELVFDSASASVSGVLLLDFVIRTGSRKMLKGYILYLDSPVTIRGNESSADRRNRKTLRGIDRILLEFPTGEPSDETAGAFVEVTGTLLNAPSGPHHTKVSMVVDDIALLDEPEDEKPVATYKTHK